MERQAMQASHNSAGPEPSDEATQGVPSSFSIPNHRHRRTASEDLGLSYDYTQTQHGFVPPSNPYPSGAPLVKDDLGTHTAGSHTRVRSWSGNHHLMSTNGVPVYPPPTQVVYSPSGSPYVPSAHGLGMHQPPSPFLSTPQTPYSGVHRKRKASGHRRVHSYSGVSSYGSLPADLPPPPSGQPTPLPHGRNRDFSPRSEFIKLTGSLRSSPVTSSPTLSYRSGARMPPQTSSFLGGQQNAGFVDPRVSFSPGTPISARDTNIAHVYGTNGSETSLSAIGQKGSGLGGEAAFLVPTTGKQRKSLSARKMHMRQRSAQLFMEDVKGVEQIPSCHDIIFLLLFVFHLLGIIYLGNTYGYEGLHYKDEPVIGTAVTIIYQNLVYVSTLSGLFAISISAIVLLLMMVLAKQIVQIALILTITLSFAWGTMGIGLSPKKVVPATGFIALALSVAYAIVVWERCKFHGANLHTSLTGLRANPGALFVAFLCQFLALGWSIYYTYVAVGVYDAVEAGDIELSSSSMRIGLYSALGVSYYWTLQVFLNIVQVTVAGVIGSWWFTKEGDTTKRAQELNRAFFRSCFYSLGSICFGSLLVGPVRVLRQISALFRPSEEASSLLCLHECIHCLQTCLTSCVDNLASRFNPWAFTYIGLYGYKLTDAGSHATELFEKRGWTTIVSDDLVPNVLLLNCFVIAGVVGCFTHALETYERLSLTNLDEPVVTSFIVGALIGFVASSVLFGIISSSVNAVVVCFAASPVDFHNNHPELSAEMRSAWREVWPGCMEVVDMRVAVASYLDPTVSEQIALLS